MNACMLCACIRGAHQVGAESALVTLMGAIRLNGFRVVDGALCAHHCRQLEALTRNYPAAIASVITGEEKRAAARRERGN